MRSLAMFTRRSHLQARGVARDGAAAHYLPCRDKHVSAAGIHRGTSHDDGELGSMIGSGAPTRRGVAVLRLEGQHTGRSRCPAARLDVAGSTQESIQGGGEKMMAAGCSRRVGSVVVAGSKETFTSAL
jgi:hypothetical protein